MIEFQVEGMSCQHCVAAVTKAIRAQDAQARVDIDLGQGQVRVASGVDAAQLAAAIVDAGYTVTRTSADDGRTV